MIVLKVGGSLFDHPALGPRLRAFVDALAPKHVLLVAGGGQLADAVRDLDRVHQLGEEAAHWLALRALRVTAAFLEQVVGAGGSAARAGGSRLAIVDCLAFALEDESRPGALPHTWAVTTDSIAARVAAVVGAERLILLKSVDIPAGTPWAAAAQRGWVDRHFPHIAATLTCPIDVVNFRRDLDTRA